QVAQAAIALGRSPVHAVVGKSAHEAFGGAQDDVETGGENAGRQLGFRLIHHAQFLHLGAGRSAGAIEQGCAWHHRPPKAGVCLLAKAVTPAAKSWVWPLAAMACDSSSICVSRLSHVAW